MSMPTSLVWGAVPDESQMAAFRGMIVKTLHDAHPPLPDKYANDLVDSIMGRIEDWDWWKHRWYGVWEDKQ